MVSCVSASNETARQKCYRGSLRIPRASSALWQRMNYFWMASTRCSGMPEFRTRSDSCSTLRIARAQRRRALKAIPGLVDIVNTAKAAIVSMELQDTPGEPEWLTAHILNQGDVNARFEWHQDTNEERKETRGAMTVVCFIQPLLS